MSRKIGVTHMAFYRGWLQGLPLRDVADLYLETGLDLRLAKTTLSWVQDELRRAALRHGRRGEARLLRLRIHDVRKVTDQAASLPSIDDFREDIDPTGFYSFDELMTRYLERYPQAGNERARRRAALLQRQINTLNWLEALLVTTPVPEDALEAWLDPNIVKRLQKGAIHTISDLIGRITERGFRWYTTVPQLGLIRATRLVKWLESYKDSLGALPAHAKVPARSQKPRDKIRPLVLIKGEAVNPLAPSIVPLEAMLLPLRPPALPGGDGRPAECFIRADNDRDAVEVWLNTLSGSPATRRAYRKEAERLVLWAMVECGLALAQLSIEDATSYRDFLCALGRVDDTAWRWRIPQAQWLAPRSTKRHSPQWRPFEAALSPKSVNYALTVCNTLTRFLVLNGYLRFNPWDIITRPRAAATAAPDLELSRMIAPPQWEALMEAVAKIEDTDARARALLILRLALVTGLRLSELVGALCENVRAVPLKSGTGTRWMLDVRGKGDRWRSVPLLPDVVQMIRESLRLRGLPDDPRSAPEGTRIITRLDGEPITESGLAWVIKQYNRLAEQYLVQLGRSEEARVFAKASAHWIRHTTGASMGDAGVPPSQIQQLLGHVSIATTSIYTATTLEKVYEAAAKTFGKDPA